MYNGKVGIVGYGAKVPMYRIKASTIAEAWEKGPNAHCPLQVSEKSVPGFDEDTITLSVEAAGNALIRAKLSPTQIGAVFVGSESHPYAVKPSAVTVADALGVSRTHFSADTEFACKAGTAAMQIVIGMVAGGMIDYGLAIGADTSQGAPGDALEYTAGAGAAAFIFGKTKIVAELIDTLSFTSDTPDFWRRPRQIYPSHAGRFTGEPAYFKHVEYATKNFLEKTKSNPKDYDHVIFHMPNGKFPRLVAKRLGFTPEQLKFGLTVDVIGNPYSAASPIGLTNVLDNARPGDMILMTSYGSGSGSDSFAFKVTKDIKIAQNQAKTTMDYINNKTYITYPKYIRMKGKLT